MSSAGWPSKTRHIDVDLEPLVLRLLDRRDRDVEHAGLAHRLVVNILQTVEMHREEKVGRRLEQMQLLLQKKRVRAQRDELLALDDAFHDRADLPMNQRFASGNGDHGSAAFVDRVEALLNRQSLVEDRIGVVDLAASRAGEVAAKQRLQHQHQRIPVAAGNPLPDEVGGDLGFPKEGNHDESLPNRLRPLGRGWEGFRRAPAEA